jgi:hypothetical protein
MFNNGNNYSNFIHLMYARNNMQKTVNIYKWGKFTITSIIIWGNA